MKRTQFNVDHDFFSGERIENVAIVSFKEEPIVYTTDLHGKKIFFNYLDFILANEKIKVILFIWPSKKIIEEEYLNFYRRLSKLRITSWGGDIKIISRFYNAINQFILKVLTCDKMIISADSGYAPLLYLSVSLACDYRIIAKNSVYSNPDIELGMIPNGGITYFLTRLIGRKKTFDILLSGNDITAAEALTLGIVDKIVPPEKLKEIALDVAETYTQKPSSYLSGVKRLTNYDMNELKKILIIEDEILQLGIRSMDKN